MKHLKMILAAVLAFALLPVAFAQELPPLGDPRTWFASPAALGGVVKIVVDLIRKHLFKTLDGAYVLVAAAVVSAVLTGAGVLFKLITTDPFAFAIGAFGAAVGWNFVLNAIGGKNAKAADAPVVDPATRSRAGL